MEEKILIKSIFAAKTKKRMITAMVILFGIFAVSFLLFNLPIFIGDNGWDAISYYADAVAIVLLCLSGVTFVPAVIISVLYLVWSKCELLITESSVKGKTLLGKEVTLPLYMITAYSTQKFMSTIIVSTASGFTRFAMIKNYEMMGQVLNQKIGERQAGVPAQAAPVATAPVAAPSATMDDLLKLKNYLDQGIITQEEFDAKKKQILGL